jgi:DNA invertase Pin-like site-specific DNA recombinase
MPAKITPRHLERAAYIYVRQSTLTQVNENLESQRRQYALATRAQALGWARVEVVDEDLGRSGSGRDRRPGFERLVSAVCLEQVGGVFALEASRLARNNRDWYHLVDLCGLTSTLMIDGEGVYDPQDFNDRLLLGLKGTMSEWELGVMRQRSAEALRQKAARGELYTTVPIGFLRTRDDRCELDPDERIRAAIATVFEKFDELGSVRQVLLWFRGEKVELPSVEYTAFGRSVVWKLPVYNSVRAILTNPMYAGAYAYGRTRTTTSVAGGRRTRRSGIEVPREDWSVLITGHHPGFIDWRHFEENQRRINENARMKGLMGSRGAAREGPALLAGLLRCRRCGRRLHVTYSGSTGRVPRYGCRGAAVNHGADACVSFGGLAADRAIAEAVLAIIQPGAIEAALQTAAQAEQERGAELELLRLKLEQARYETARTRRQYDAVDPENRLVAAELERRWNASLQEVARLEQEHSLVENGRSRLPDVDREGLLRLAEDLPRVWNDASADMRIKKRIVRTLIEEILADVDDEGARIELIVRWIGGQHSRLSIRKVRKGEHRHSTDLQVVDIVRELATTLSDGQIARVLNRLSLKTGRGNSWIASRVNSLRHYHGIPVYDPQQRAVEGVLTLEEVAEVLRVSPPVVRRLLERRILPGRQVVPHAPWSIHRSDLDLPGVQEYVGRVHQGRNGPQTEHREQLSILPTNL